MPFIVNRSVLVLGTILLLAYTDLEVDSAIITALLFTKISNLNCLEFTVQCDSTESGAESPGDLLY